MDLGETKTLHEATPTPTKPLPANEHDVMSLHSVVARSANGGGQRVRHSAVSFESHRKAGQTNLSTFLSGVLSYVNTTPFKSERSVCLYLRRQPSP